jgi:nicotinamidase-related amidase
MQECLIIVDCQKYARHYIRNRTFNEMPLCEQCTEQEYDSVINNIAKIAPNYKHVIGTLWATKTARWDGLTESDKNARCGIFSQCTSPFYAAADELEPAIASSVQHIISRREQPISIELSNLTQRLNFTDADFAGFFMGFCVSATYDDFCLNHPERRGIVLSDLCRPIREQKFRDAWLRRLPNLSWR